MKKYSYKTDAESGEIEAESLIDARDRMIREARLTPVAIADGAWGWVEDENGDRMYVAQENMR